MHSAYVDYDVLSSKLHGICCTGVEASRCAGRNNDGVHDQHVRQRSRTLGRSATRPANAGVGAREATRARSGALGDRRPKWGVRRPEPAVARYATGARSGASDFRSREMAFALICDTRDSLTVSNAAISCSLSSSKK